MSSFRFTVLEWRVIAIFAYAVGIGMADSQALTPLTVEIDAAFGFIHHESKYLLASYFIGAALAAAIAGPGSDRWGRRLFFVAGVGTACIADLLCYFANSFWILVMLRLFVGMGIGTCALTYLAYMGDMFPYERRGMAMGLVSVGFFAGLTFGPIVAAKIDTILGWRGVFLAFSIADLLGLVMVVLGLPKVTTKQVQKGGLRGLAREWKLFHIQPGTCLVLLAFAAQAASAFAFSQVAPMWLEAVYQWSPEQRSYIFIWFGVGTLIASPAAGYLADVFGKIPVADYSSWAIAITLFGIPFVPMLPGALGGGFSILLIATIMGVFFGIRSTPLFALVTQVVPKRQRGNFLALKSVWTYIGIALGILIGNFFYLYAYRFVPVKMIENAKNFLVNHLPDLHVYDTAMLSDSMSAYFGFIVLGLFAGFASILTAILLRNLGRIPNVEHVAEEN